ncbi:hypothetical protein K3495_g6247 [Podosphaera aphanis]|nr:hypothetical protein K3495_g6247 [Podosphaera aphanis]
MIQNVIEARKRREAERVRIEEEAFEKAKQKAIENNETHVHFPPYLPVCLTKLSGTPAPGPTAKGPEPAESAPTKQA